MTDFRVLRLTALFSGVVREQWQRPRADSLIRTEVTLCASFIPSTMSSDPQEPRRSQRLAGTERQYPREAPNRRTRSTRGTNLGPPSSPTMPPETNIPANTPTNEGIRSLVFQISPTGTRDPLDYGPGSNDLHSPDALQCCHTIRDDSDRIEVRSGNASQMSPTDECSPYLCIRRSQLRRRL